MQRGVIWQFFHVLNLPNLTQTVSALGFRLPDNDIQSCTGFWSRKLPAPRIALPLGGNGRFMQASVAFVAGLWRRWLIWWSRHSVRGLMKWFVSKAFLLWQMRRQTLVVFLACVRFSHITSLAGVFANCKVNQRLCYIVVVILIIIIIKIIIILLLLIIMIIMKSFYKRSSHGHHGWKRRELTQHALSRGLRSQLRRYGQENRV